MPQSVGDKFRRRGVPVAFARVCVEVVMDGSRSGSAMSLQVQGKAPQCFDRAKERVVVGGVAYLFAFDCVLLVGKFQGSVGDALDVCFIQRSSRGGVDMAVNREVDVPELKGLGSSFRCGRLSVFGRPQEPVESNDDEVNDMSVEGSLDRMVLVKDFGQLSDDGGVDWVGPCGGGVVVFHGFPES